MALNKGYMQYRTLTREEQAHMILYRAMDRINLRLKSLPPGTAVFNEKEMKEIYKALLVMLEMKLPGGSDYFFEETL